MLLDVDIRVFESEVSVGDQFQFTTRYENWYTQIVILGLITSREYASSDSTLELGESLRHCLSSTNCHIGDTRAFAQNMNTKYFRGEVEMDLDFVARC